MEYFIVQITNALTILGFFATLIILWFLRQRRDALFMCFCWLGLVCITQILFDAAYDLNWISIYTQQIYRRITGRGFLSIGILWFLYSLLRRNKDVALIATVTMNIHSRILSWDWRAEELFGYSRVEAIGADLAVLLIPERDRDSHYEGVRRWVANHTLVGLSITRFPARTYQAQARHKDGREIPVQIIIVPVGRPNGTVEFHGALQRLARF